MTKLSYHVYAVDGFETAHRWIASRLDGTRTVHASRAALDRARRRATGDRVVVDSWPESAPPPTGGDVRTWDAYRTRRGYAGGV